MNNKKIVTYKCTTCNRTKDYEASKLHSFIDLCSITLNCSGKLLPIATKSLRNVLASAPVDGVPDWISRFENTNANQITSINSSEQNLYVTLASSSSLALSLAVKRQNPSINNNPSSFTVSFATQQFEVSTFDEFTYFITSTFNSVSGPDTTSSKKVLRFTSSDIVKVFLNGVELSEGTLINEYRLTYNGQNGYKVVFNTSYSVSSTVKVIVYQNQNIVLSNPITFTRNTLLVSSLDNQTSWSNVSTIEYQNDIFDVYTCLDTLSLPANQILNVYPNGNHFSSNIVSPELSSFRFLLSYPPFSVIDRIYSAFISFDNLSDVDNHIRLYSNKGSITLEVSKSSVSYVSFAPLLHVADDNLEWLSSATISITDDTSIIPNNPYIIGPI